ncbi:serine hydrolase domain-containing protein [Parasphingorhabdus sp.]|jgi:CubicO group peptidase (beta-lactamase class C family)|uniref:serine hydrolase domain-containing protein n=1 Tax=Parasphingorhabdus sp. TaxID=2709688 RepID=UPI0030A2AB7E|nr:beta-lactamase family protein [Sphingomonadales bacterium]
MILTFTKANEIKAGAYRSCLLFLSLIAFATPAHTDQLLPGPPAAIRVDFTADSISVTAIQGYSNRTTGRVLTPEDPVRIASVSKLFVALGVMRLVEKQQLDLEADVNDYLDWSLRNPAFPEKAITLADLLSHQSGLRDGINYALPMDALLEEELRDPKAWDGNHPPGTYFSYANLNFPVIAAIMEAASGKRFDRIMQEEVFRPLGLYACFNWVHCSDARIAAAVTLYRPDGSVARDDLRGVRETCAIVPARDGTCDVARYRLGKTGSIFSPQGGLRISAMDLARVGQMFLRDDGQFLTQDSLKQMLVIAWSYDGQNGDSEDGYFCAYGLAVHVLPAPFPSPGCKDDPFDDAIPRWGHSGEAYSLKSGLWFQMKDQSGTAFFRTEVPDNDPAGHCIYFCD